MLLCNFRNTNNNMNIGNSHKILGAKLFIVCIEIADLVMISLTILRLIKITIITVN